MIVQHTRLDSRDQHIALLSTIAFAAEPKGDPRTVVVTGATAGVGRAIARRFARAGDQIGLIARDAMALDDVRRELEDLGAEACPKRSTSPTRRRSSPPPSASRRSSGR